MKAIVFTLFGVVVAALAGGPAVAWSHANRYGGSSSWGGGSWSHTGARGGTASGGGGSWSAHGAYGGSASGGGGSWNAHGAYGGTASGGEGSWTAHSAYGTTAYHSTGYGTTVYASPDAHTTTYYGGRYYGYHPPTTVNYYGSGCYDCGGWSSAGAAVAGATLGVLAGRAASDRAYAASAGTTYAMGGIYATLPAACSASVVAGTTYYLCGTTWFQPSYGANGVYYRVVPAP